VPNVIFIQAALPTELNGVADEVHIPWGSLLRVVAPGDETVLRNLLRICTPGALLEMNIGLDPERVPIYNGNAWPETPTDEFLEQTLISRYVASGFDILEKQVFAPSE
jgi:hypothetical protein